MTMIVETTIYKCNAPLELFLPDYNDVPDELKLVVESLHNGLGCEGGGLPGRWCSGCPFEERETIEEAL